MPEGPVIGERIAATLNAARASMHRHRYYAAMQEFRLAEQLILGLVGDAPVPSSRPPARLQTATALMLRRLILMGAEMRLARHAPPVAPVPSRRPAVSADIRLARTPRQAQALLEFAAGKTPSQGRFAPEDAPAFRPAGLSGVIDGALLRVPPVDPEQVPEELARFFFHDIPLGLADCLVQIEQDYDQAIAYYLRVADYAFEIGELPIAAPALWLRLAEAHLARGDAAYRTNNGERARAHYEMILKDGQPPADSPLYDGGLGIMIAKVRSWLLMVGQGPGALAATPPARHLAALAKTQQRLFQLDANLDVFGNDVAWRPIFSFSYLRDVARGFAQVAAQANREYVANIQRAEDQTQNVRQLEQAVAMGEAGEALEQARLEEVRREVSAARAAEELARARAELAARNLEKYRDLGYDITVLDRAIAWSNAAVGPNQPQIYSGIEWLGISAKTRNREDLLWELTRVRSQRAFEIELDRLSNVVAELEEAAVVAQRQSAAAAARVSTANANVEAARWRTQFSRENLTAAESRELTADVFFDLAVFARQTAQIYLDRAISAAKHMELAFNFEHNTETERIRADYGDLGGAGGIYAADLLLRDIDAFTHELLGEAMAKDQLIVEAISLRREFPLQFLEFLQTGRMVFQTTLDQFHSAMPGSYNGRIKRVDVDFMALGRGADVRASLSCAGTSSFRDATGAVRRKVHPSETLLVSPLAMQGSVSDVLRAQVRPNQLNLFENVGLGCSWRLEVPLRANDIELHKAADVTLLVTYVCRHDVGLEAQDIAAQPETGKAEMSLGLRDQGRSPLDEPIWGVLETRGEATFRIDPRWMPRNFRDPKVTAITLVCARKDGRAQPLRVRFAGEGIGSLDQVIEPEPSNVTRVERPEAPGPFYDALLGQAWRLRLDPAENPNLRGDGTKALNLGALDDISVVFAFDHKYRGA